MPVTLVTTPGTVNANSYATEAEATAYFNSRLPLVPPWEDADDPTAALVMSTRVLDAFVQALRVYIPAGSTGGSRPYYLTRRKWTGRPASETQRRAWPRLGMYDFNGNPLDFTITAAVGSPTVITTSGVHRYTTGDTVFIIGSDSTPSIDGAYTVTVVSSTTFSIPVAVTVAGTVGYVTHIPLALKEAQSELAGQLLIEDTTLDNDIRVNGISSVRAGSVAVSFKDMIQQHVLPAAVWLLMPSSWLTDEIHEPVNPYLFDVVSE